MMKPLFYAGLAAIVLGTVLGMFPRWKSATLSPASIQRRCYWTGSFVGALLLFIAVLPDWKSAVFVAAAVLAVLVVVAYRFTSHIKLGGKVYGYMRDQRHP
ncbi:hypothetical protein MAGR_41530 [Mycolicibacterium agri]|nr:hypothetical protein [Mycolicibacterium agri]GFG52712.1 hypothetical protein MAGR_41530 [Mycolicibacterium agri]